MRKIFILFFISISCNVLLAQKTFKGKVVDETGVALPGVNILEKSTASNGTISDIDGNWELKVADENSILIFSFLGMETIEVVASNSTLGNRYNQNR